MGDYTHNNHSHKTYYANVKHIAISEFYRQICV